MQDNKRKIIKQARLAEYTMLYLDQDPPKIPYFKYDIDGTVYDPVPCYDASKLIAVEAAEDFTGKTVTFV